MNGYLDISSVVRRLEAQLQDQAAEIETLLAGELDVHTVHAQGAIAPFVVAPATLVRVNVPPLIGGDVFPDDGGWIISAGILEYAGRLSGLYEVHCPVAFSTSVATAQIYTWQVVEGLGLGTGAPLRRDTATYSVEKQLATSDTTANATGYLRLQPTGGQIAIFVSHTAGIAATIEATTFSLVLQRSRRD